MPTTLSEQLEQYKFRWSNATKRYAQTYPDKKVNGNSTQNDRAYQSVIQIANELLLFNSNLKGDIANSKTYINDADEKIQKVKKEHEEQKAELVSAVGNNKAAKPFKIDKYDENSESYINIVAYIIAICSTSFFIYKQIKQ